MADYTTEIAALNEAIASGMLRLEYDGRKFEYGSFADLLARKNYLEALTIGGPARPPAPQPRLLDQMQRAFSRETGGRD